MKKKWFSLIVISLIILLVFTHEDIKQICFLSKYISVIAVIVFCISIYKINNYKDKDNKTIHEKFALNINTEIYPMLIISITLITFILSIINISSDVYIINFILISIYLLYIILIIFIFYGQYNAYNITNKTKKQKKIYLIIYLICMLVCVISILFTYT